MSSPTFEPTPKSYFLPCRQVRDKCGYPKQKTAKLSPGCQAGDQCSKCNQTGFAWRPASAISEKFAS